MSIMLEDCAIVARAKGGLVVFEGNLSDFPPAIIAKAAAYAIHKKCQDASGGDNVTEADAKKKAEAVVIAMKAGTWATRGGGARATNEDDFIIGRLVAYIRAEAKKANAEVPVDTTARATASAIMRSEKPKALALVAQYRAEWTAKNTAIADLI